MQQILETLREKILPWASRGEMRLFPDEQLQFDPPGQLWELTTCPQPFRPYYEWQWMIAGEAPLRIGQTMYLLRPGDFCLFPPLVDRIHAYDRKTAAFQSLCFAYWPGTLHAHFFDYAPFGTWSVPQYFACHGSPALPALLTEMHQETLTDRPHKSYVLQGLVLQLTTASLRDLEAAVAIPGLQLNADSAVGRVLRLLHERYDHNWTMDALAQEAHLHPHYLGTLFKAQTGRTVFETLRDVRVEHAKSLLLEDSLPLREIARAVGYSNADRFARVFREATGQPPTQFGKRSRGT